MKIFVTIAAVAVAGIAGVALIVMNKRKGESSGERWHGCQCGRSQVVGRKPTTKSDGGGVREKFRQFKEKFGCKCCKDTCDNEDNVDNYDEFDLDGNDF